MSDPEFITETFDAIAAPDGSAAQLEISASAGEFDGIVLAITRPHAAESKYFDVMVPVQEVRHLVTALDTAMRAEEPYRHQVPAIANYDDSPALVEVEADGDQEGFFLTLTSDQLDETARIVLDDTNEEAVLVVLQRCIDYLVANGYDA